MIYTTKNCFLFVSFLLISIVSQAAVLVGKVTDEQHQPLAFASIYILGYSNGTTTNMDGHYQLVIPEGTYTIICQYVGFKKVEKSITITQANTIHDFILESNYKNLKEIVVKNGDNLAIPIIKKTIAKRSFYNNELDGFKANVYNKGSFKVDDASAITKLNNSIGNKKNIQETKKEIDEMQGIIHLSETFSEVYYKKPDKLKIIVKSSKVSGKSSGYGFSNPLFVNFYDNNVNFIENFTPRGIISPIADNALLCYNYELLNAYSEGNKIINVIKVTPKRKQEPTFSGIIEIIENEWRLNSINLKIDKSAELNLADTLKIKQHFFPIDNKMLVKDQSFNIKMNVFGIKITGNFVNVFNNYVFDIDTKKSFDKYLVEYDKDALLRSSDYWAQNRPIPLDTEEVADYRKKDSLAVFEKIINDSLEKRKNNLRDLFVNGLHFRLSEKTKITTTPLLSIYSANFNTVEGINYKYGIKYKHHFSDERKLTSILNMRYGFSNHQFNANLNTAYTIGKTNIKTIRFQFGRNVFQYNNANPVDEIINTFYTLFYAQNNLKIYQSFFSELSFNYQHISGINLTTSLSYQDRKPLRNTNLFSFDKNKSNFTENFPTDITTQYESGLHAMIATIQATYQPGKKYIKYSDKIEATRSKYPTFFFKLNYGLSILNSQVDFSKYQLSVWDDMQLKLLGTFRYNISCGGFLHYSDLSVIDYIHFNGNQTIYASDYLNSFQLSPYYANSTITSFYAKANIEHHFYGLITNKIPLLKKLDWYLVASSNAYYVNNNNHYLEVSLGLENIGFKLMRFLRVDGVVGCNRLQKPMYGIRISLSNKLFSVSKNKMEEE